MKLRRIIAAGILICSFVISPCVLALESKPEEVAVESISIPDENKIEVAIPRIKKIETNLVKQQETEVKENETYTTAEFAKLYYSLRLKVVAATAQPGV